MAATALRAPRRDGRLSAILLFLPPALLLFSLFVVMPIGEAAWYSLFNWNGFGRPTNWVGLNNYFAVFETRAFGIALRNNGLSEEEKAEKSDKLAAARAILEARL